MTQPKSTWTTTEIANLMGEPDVRKARRWAMEAGALIRREGASSQWIMTDELMREHLPRLWRRYCATESIWDSDECEHEDPEVSDCGCRWCPDCGALRRAHGRWRAPARCGPEDG